MQTKFDVGDVVFMEIGGGSIFHGKVKSITCSDPGVIYYLVNDRSLTEAELYDNPMPLYQKLDAELKSRFLQDAARLKESYESEAKFYVAKGPAKVTVGEFS